MKGKAFNVKKIHFLRVDPNEELVGTIQNYAEKAGIKAASVSFIGALRNMKIIVPGNADRVEPIIKEFNPKSEIVGDGTITLKDGKVFPHLHFMRSDDTYEVKGGHLVSGEVIITVEVTIIEADGIVNRILDPITKLNKMQLD
jgi:uncharacterized protein